MNRWELEKQIVFQALKDPAFKKKLESNPKAAIEELLKKEGMSTDALGTLQVRVVQEKENEILIPMPYIAGRGKTFSSEELQQLDAGYCTHSVPNCADIGTIG